MNRKAGRTAFMALTMMSMQHAALILSLQPMLHRDVASIPLGAWDQVSERSLPRRLARRTPEDLNSAICSLLLHQSRTSDPGARSGNFKSLVNMEPPLSEPLKGNVGLDSTIPFPLSQSSFPHMNKEADNG